MPSSLLSTEISDPVNARILAVSEDRIAGFHEDPFVEIARLSELPVETIIERLRAMLESGVVRRIRQTLMATNLAPGALVAWQVPTDRLDAAFQYLAEQDPFSGHVVIRSTDAETPGSIYRLWTTLKVPQGFSMHRHSEFLAKQIGAVSFRIMPAKCLFALGVGHVRRRGMEPGSRSAELGEVLDTNLVELSALEWRGLATPKRELAPAEGRAGPWGGRAGADGIPYDEVLRGARGRSRSGEGG